MAATKQLILSQIDEYLSSPRNTLQTVYGEKAWDDALVGFSSGADPLYEQLKSDIGSFYWTPLEAFILSFPAITCKPGDLTIVSWVLPQTAATREDQRRRKKYPAERWSRSRSFGEQRFLVRKTSPPLPPLFPPPGVGRLRENTGLPPTGRNATPPMSPDLAP